MEAAKAPVATAVNLASSAASYLPGSSPTTATGTGLEAATGAAGHGHSHSEERSTKGKQLPPDAEASEVKKMDSEGLAVFEDADVRHAVLVKINQLAMYVPLLPEWERASGRMSRDDSLRIGARRPVDRSFG